MGWRREKGSMRERREGGGRREKGSTREDGKVRVGWEDRMGRRIGWEVGGEDRREEARGEYEREDGKVGWEERMGGEDVKEYSQQLLSTDQILYNNTSMH